MKYRKKPREVEAFRFNIDDSPEWFQDAVKEGKVVLYKLTESCKIVTPEGTMIGKKGDYIIKGIRGEIYPCQKDIFEEIYEEVEKKYNKIPDLYII